MLNKPGSSNINQLDLDENMERHDQINFIKKQSTKESQVRLENNGSVIKFKNNPSKNFDNADNQIYSDIKLQNNGKNLHFFEIII